MLTGTPSVGCKREYAPVQSAQLIQVIPDRDLVVVTATEVREDDPTSRGIDENVLPSIIEDAVVSQFPTE